MYITQISIFVENKEGKLKEITEVLFTANINIRAMSLADTTDFGILRLIVSEPERAIATLKAAGFTVTKTEVLGVALNDSPGGLNAVLSALADNGIALEYAYAFTAHLNDETAFVVLRVEDNQKAANALSGQGIHVLSDREVEKI